MSDIEDEEFTLPGWSRRPDGLWERTAPPPGLRECDVLMIEQRNVWQRSEVAPEDIPDPFGQQWWTLMQVLVWVYRRDPAVVRLVAPPEPFETTYTIKDPRVLGRNGACYPRIENAGDAVIEALQAGRLTATGFLNGERDDRKEIPPLSWVDLVFRFEPYYFAGPKDPTRTRPYWVDLQFPRKEVLAVWPDPQKSLAVADKPAAAKADRGPAANEPIAKRKAPDIFIAVLNDLIAEITKRAAEKGMPFDVTKMPGTKADFRALAEKYDDKLEKAERTFNDYLVGVLRFKRGARETAFYRDLFPEYF